MNKNRIGAIVGAVLAAALCLLWLGYHWGRHQTPTFISSPFSSLSPSLKIAKKPLSELFHGLTLQTSLLTPQATQSATIIRKQPPSYRVEIILHAVLPQANTSAEQLAHLVPALPEVLRDFNFLLSNAKISPAFATLYENKIAVLRQNLLYLEQAVSRQNFYDCETMLHLENPQTGRRAILGIGPMNVNTDGSDGDRNVFIDRSSFTFQPTTSYRWAKTSKRPNPFVEATERELAQIKAKFSENPQTMVADKNSVKYQQLLTDRLRELARWSFLASTADPFIVLPEFFFRTYSGPFAPKIGDFALVLYEKTAYPAIVGDAGPTYKFGEASLRICREINKTASGINRAVSQLRVAYLVFPGTAMKPWQTPDLKVWNARCASFLEELGGNGKLVFQWPNNIPPWPTAFVTPSTTPTSPGAPLLTPTAP